MNEKTVYEIERPNLDLKPSGTRSHLPGAKTLLLGDTGTGKTHAIRTFLEAGIQPFVVFTEPGMEIVNDLNMQGEPCKIHWTYIAPAAPDWTAMLDSAKKINSMTLEQLARLSDVQKKEYQEFINILNALHDYTCDRCGRHFGDVSDWGTDRALIVDSLSGLNVMAMNLVVGSKPVKSMADWGIALDNLERLLTKLTVDTRCFFVLTAHLEREVDEVTGGTQLMASTLGRKLAPRLPRFFSDVIHAKREGDKFTWSTVTTNVALKARNLPLADKQPPSFKPLVDQWVKRGGLIEKEMK